MLSIQKSTYHTGFTLTFANNNLTISVQFGSGNYCNNRVIGLGGSEVNECPDAEIAVWNEFNQWFNFGSDTVKGWVSADDVAKWIHAVQSATNLTDIVVPS